MMVGAIDNDQTAEIKVTDCERKNSKVAKIVGIGEIQSSESRKGNIKKR
ncbi:hypothetical protein [Desulfosporosinus sp. SB140]